MDFFDVIQTRYSVRSYKPQLVEKEKLNIILNAVRLAPTAANKQPFRFYVMVTEGRKDDLLRIYAREWFTHAPLVICACAAPSLAWIRRDGKNYSEVDTTIAMDHLILAATSLGLGTCWIAAFDASAAREILQLPKDIEPIAFTPLGYPADIPKVKKRKEIDDFVIYR